MSAKLTKGIYYLEVSLIPYTYTYIYTYIERASFLP